MDMSSDILVVWDRSVVVVVLVLDKRGSTCGGYMHSAARKERLS